MRIVTVREPHAYLLAIGAKHFEIRSWQPAPTVLAPGDQLGIHAGMWVPSYAQCDWTNVQAGAMYEALRQDRSYWDKFRSWHQVVNVVRMGYLPLGEVVAVCHFLQAIRTDSMEALDYLAHHPAERLFGDWSPGRWAWELEVIEKLQHPVPARGRQGLWEWEPPEWFALAEYLPDAPEGA